MTNAEYEAIKQEIKTLADYDTVDALVEVLRIMSKYVEESDTDDET